MASLWEEPAITPCPGCPSTEVLHPLDCKIKSRHRRLMASSPLAVGPGTSAWWMEGRRPRFKLRGQPTCVFSQLPWPAAPGAAPLILSRLPCHLGF